MVAKPPRGRLNRENEHFPVPVRAWKFGRRVQPSRPASACSFSTIRLNLVLSHGIPPAFRDGVHLFISPTATGLVPNLSRLTVAYRWRSLPRVRRRKASSPQGTVVSVTGAAFSSITMDQQLMCASRFPRPLLVTVGMRDTESLEGVC